MEETYNRYATAKWGLLEPYVSTSLQLAALETLLQLSMRASLRKLLTNVLDCSKMFIGGLNWETTDRKLY